MDRRRLLAFLQGKGYKAALTKGGIEVIAEKQVPLYEFDYKEFVYEVLEGKVEKEKVHMLDPWTFMIECE